MTGVSLRGTVEKREKESVYLKLDIDGADGKALHPYPWIPPTGNVMYCMPQEGTEAYLYFPEAEEESAYAVSEIHNSRCPVFADAQRRELVTEHGKKLRLHADMLGFAGGKEETVQECRMREDGIHFGAGRGKLQVTGREQILFHAPEISLDAVQKIGQYKMESMAKEKAGMLYPRGGGNPATGGDGYGVGELQNEYNALSSQGILAGTEYEYYKPFDDAPEYEEYKEVPTWLKVVAGVAVAAVVGLAVGALVVATGGLAAAALGVTAVQLGMTAGVLTAGAGIAAVAATASSDRKNGTESSLGDYISNAFSASARVGASCIAITLGMYGAEVMTLTVSGGMGLIPVGGTVVTLPQLAGAFQLVAGIVTSQNLLFQMREVLMFCISGKEMGAPTGNWLYDSARELTEMASMQFAVYGLMNPYTYQRPKITPLPNETGLTVPGGTGVAVVPNGTAPALNPPYLPGQYTEYPAAVQGWAQQALPGGGSGIESGLNSNLLDELANSGVKYNPEDIVAITKTADGKLVWLNAGSRITYSQGFGVGNRKIELIGEGYFEVKRNEEVPFLVKTNSLLVKVLGTKFNFRDYPDDAEAIVSLSEGKVALNNLLKKEKEAFLLPNERVVLNKKNGRMHVEYSTVSNALQWTNGYLFFDEELLPDVVKELERSYNVKIQIASDTLNTFRFYGNFVHREQNIQEVLEALSATRKIHYIIEGHNITLY